MGLKRLVLKLNHNPDLSSSEQESFVVDVGGIVDGDDIDGFMITGGSNSWLEMEGDENDVDSAATEVKNLSDVDSSSTNADQSISSRSLDHWFGAVKSDTLEKN